MSLTKQPYGLILVSFGLYLAGALLAAGALIAVLHVLSKPDNLLWPAPVYLGAAGALVVVALVLWAIALGLDMLWDIRMML